jgi:MATE family multidrug resistance protein
LFIASDRYSHGEASDPPRQSPGLVHDAWTFEMEPMQKLLALGAPAAIQVTLEVGVFAAATALAGRLAPASLAAHQIAINLAAVTFMVPLGVASAGAVRVGHAVAAATPTRPPEPDGRRFCLASPSWRVQRPRSCSFHGRSSARSHRIRRVVDWRFAALRWRDLSAFRWCAGVSTGVLRGLGDTRTPMLWNLAGHWFIGLPLGTRCACDGSWRDWPVVGPVDRPDRSAASRY